VEDTRQPEAFAPRAPGRIVVEAKDPAGGLPWAARAYTSRNGRECILAGRRRGFSLGVIKGGEFHAYAPSARGVCGELARIGLLVSSTTFTEPHVRTIVFGRAAPGVRTVRVEGPGPTRDAPVGPAGAFLLVYDGRVQTTDLNVRRMD
jgi:hypothetical protein